MLDALSPEEPLVEEAATVLRYDIRRRVEIAARDGAFPTDLAQPAIFVASMISWKRALQAEQSFDYLAGHSLGEYAALVAARALSFEAGLRVVTAKANAMHAAARRTPGGMIAVLGLDLVTVEQIAHRDGVAIANDNAPGQVVLSGSDERLANAAASARAAGGRSILLGVGGPYHSGAMEPAIPQLRAALERVEIRLPQVPIVANATARPYRAPGEIRKLLVSQLTGRVRFRESLQWLWERGVRHYDDLGPGQVVAGLAKRTFLEMQRGEVAAHA